MGKIVFDQSRPPNIERMPKLKRDLDGKAKRPILKVKTERRIRVYFVFNDALDDSGVNMSYVELKSEDPWVALGILAERAKSGELWKHLYPRESGPDYGECYQLILDKMSFIDITNLPEVWNDRVLIS